MASDRSIKIVVVDASRQVRSHGWRLGVGRTSFYIKSLDDRTSFKISVHGPDPNPKYTWTGFKMGYDHGDERAKRSVIHTPGWLPVRFAGRAAADCEAARLVVRLRIPWDVFHTHTLGDYPRAKSGDQAVILTSPGAPYATDVDVYVSQGRPYWPREKTARADNAIVGPLVNDANQYLTAVLVKSNMLTIPTPHLALGQPPRDRDDAVRGHGGCVDADHDFAWVVEQWLSRTLLRQGDAAAMLLREHTPPAWSPNAWFRSAPVSGQWFGASRRD